MQPAHLCWSCLSNHGSNHVTLLLKDYPRPPIALRIKAKLQSCFSGPAGSGSRRLCSAISYSLCRQLLSVPHGAPGSLTVRAFVCATHFVSNASPSPLQAALRLTWLIPLPLSGLSLTFSSLSPSRPDKVTLSAYLCSPGAPIFATMANGCLKSLSSMSTGTGFPPSLFYSQSLAQCALSLGGGSVERRAFSQLCVGER